MVAVWGAEEVECCLGGFGFLDGEDVGERARGEEGLGCLAEGLPGGAVGGEEDVGVVFADEVVGDVVVWAGGVDVAAFFEESGGNNDIQVSFFSSSAMTVNAHS